MKRRFGPLVGWGLLGLSLNLGGCPETELGPELVVRSVRVFGDADRDGRLAPGESASLEVRALNVGTETSTGGGCVVRSLTEGITVDATRDDDLYFGFCDVDGTCDDAVNVVVEPGVAPGTVANFECNTDPENTDQSLDGLRFSITIGTPDVVLAIADLAVLDDTDRDGVLNPGESARLSVTLHNDGTSDLTASRCVVGTGTPGVTVQAAAQTLEFRHCRWGQSCGTAEFRVTLTPEIVPGTEVEFRCALVDESERTWPISMRFRVEAPAAKPRLSGVLMDDDGDDGQLNPGEGGRLQVTLQNIGVAGLPASSCVVTSDADWLTIQAGVDRLDYGFCAADADCRTASIRVLADAEAPPGGSTTLTCALEDQRGLRYEVLIPLTLGL